MDAEISDALEENYGFKALAAKKLGISYAALITRLNGKKMEKIKEKQQDIERLRDELIQHTLFNKAMNGDLRAITLYKKIYRDKEITK